MKLKIKHRLNEELIQEDNFTVSVPIRVKFRTDMSDEEDIVKEIGNKILVEVTEEVDFKLNKIISRYMGEMLPKIREELGTALEVTHLTVNLEPIRNVAISNGILFFDVFIDNPVDKGRTQSVFNTLLNNNVIGTELSFTFEDDYYDMFDVFVTVEKLDKVEVGYE